MESDRSKWDFFIAYASADRTIARSLYEMLRPKSNVFFDKVSLQLGDNWDQELPRAQRDSAVTVVLVSTNTDDAYYAKEEVLAAIELAKNPKYRHRVVPIFLAPMTSDRHDVPYGLRRKHGMNISSDGELKLSAQRLLELMVDAMEPEPVAQKTNRWGDLIETSQDTPDNRSAFFPLKSVHSIIPIQWLLLGVAAIVLAIWFGPRFFGSGSSDTEIPPKDSPVVLAGTVYDKDTRQPLADVKLTLQDFDNKNRETPTCLSDDQGRFRFTGLPASASGQVDLRAEKQGYQQSHTDPWLGNMQHTVTLKKE